MEREKQNLTVHLSRDTIRRAKLLAAERGTSISGLVAETLLQLTASEVQYEASRNRAMMLLDRGFHLGGKGLPDRDALHDRS